MRADLITLEKKINYSFNNKMLLQEAVTHRSYAAERKLNFDNQRLEFLGDAVIQIIITTYLYNHFPIQKEGELTKLRASIVQRSTLALFANTISLNDFLFMGKGELDSKGNERESTLCDVFEALIGAIYLDSNLTEAEKVFMNIFNPIYDNISTLIEDDNPKGTLQEHTQKKLNSKPDYSITNMEGPQHNPTYIVDVKINGNIVGTGKGANKKIAEAEAAKSALKNLKITD